MLLALAVAAELYVVFDKVLGNSILASLAGVSGWLVMNGVLVCHSAGTQITTSGPLSIRGTIRGKAQPREITCSTQVPVENTAGKKTGRRIAPNPYRQLGYVDLAAKAKPQFPEP